MERKRKTRLTLALVPALYDSIEKDAATYGISMSAYCTFIVGQYYSTKERMLESSNEKLNDLMNGMANDLKKF